jgi:hypothetical protein
MKSVLLAVANVLAFVWQLLPRKLRRMFFKGMFVLESRGDPKAALVRLFKMTGKSSSASAQWR